MRYKKLKYRNKVIIQILKKIPNFLKISLFVIFCHMTINAQQRAPIVSPEIHADNTVTFRFMAPEAQKVELNAQFLKERTAMTKDENGLWYVKTQPVTPDIYPYCFVVDGVTVSDPNNVNLFPNERFKNSLVDVMGKTPLIHSIQDVPHGKITYEYYNSKILDDTRPLLIYTPPGYNSQSEKRYPVLFLIHGMTDTHETWYKVGRINFILDNLIAQGKATPMIVVMPYANTRLSYLGTQISVTQDTGVNLFNENLIKEIIPFVEHNYNVVANGANRAIAGFSLGGRQTLDAGLTYPDLFSYVCAFAPAAGIENFSNGIYASANDLTSKLKLLYLSCGIDDTLYPRALDIEKKLNETGVPFEKFFNSGGHTWMNCRIYFSEITQKIFKE